MNISNKKNKNMIFNESIKNSILSENSESKINKHLPFIKILYEGIKLKSFPLASDIELFRGSKISHNEIQKIEECLNKKKKIYLP